MKEECRKQLESCWKNELEFDVWKQRREKDWKKRVEEHLPELGKSIATDNLFNYLESKKVFDRRTLESVKHQPGMYAQVSAMLGALSKLPFTNFLLFCESLIETNQTDVIAQFLTPEVPYIEAETAKEAPVERPDDGVSLSVDYDWKSCIRHNFVKLTEDIDPDSGLLNELLAAGVIDKTFADVVKSHKGRVNRVIALLNHLSNFRPDADFVKFCQALERTNQAHIVSCFLSRKSLAEKSGSSEETTTSEMVVPPDGFLSEHVAEEGKLALNNWLTAEQRELSKDWKSSLVNYRSNISDEIDVSNSFIDLLVKMEIMNVATAERCREEDDDVARTEYVLDHMNRRSSGDFSKFCQALQKTGQIHIVKEYLSAEVKTLTVPVVVRSPADVPDTPNERHNL